MKNIFTGQYNKLFMKAPMKWRIDANEMAIMQFFIKVKIIGSSRFHYTLYEEVNMSESATSNP